MITNPADESMVLFDLSDLDADPPEHDLARAYGPQLRTVAQWAATYLCRPHPELGRRGAVCPYTQASMERGRFRLAVRPGRPQSVGAVIEAMAPYRDWFADLAPRGRGDSLLSTVLVLFPDLGERVSLIDAAQTELKDTYVPLGLMIGEFHPGPPDRGGLWNPLFRPLRSPVPMLVIRHMVATDLPFLAHDPGYVAAYRGLFGDQVPAHLRDTFSGALGGGSGSGALGGGSGDGNGDGLGDTVGAAVSDS